MENRNIEAGELVFDVSAWLSGMPNTETAVIKYACKRGAEKLQSIAAYLDGGELPAWVTEDEAEREAVFEGVNE